MVAGSGGALASLGVAEEGVGVANLAALVDTTELAVTVSISPWEDATRRMRSIQVKSKRKQRKV